VYTGGVDVDARRERKQNNNGGKYLFFHSAWILGMSISWTHQHLTKALTQSLSPARKKKHVGRQRDEHGSERDVTSRLSCPLFNSGKQAPRVDHMDSIIANIRTPATQAGGQIQIAKIGPERTELSQQKKTAHAIESSQCHFSTTGAYNDSGDLVSVSCETSDDKSESEPSRLEGESCS
jgi:hypothetical protein